MGFLKKIFRRKSKKDALVVNKESSDSNTSTESKKLSRKERRAIKKAQREGSFLAGSTAMTSQQKKQQMNSMASGVGRVGGSPPQAQDRPQKRTSPRDRNSQQQQQQQHSPQYAENPMITSDSNPYPGPTGNPQEMIRKPAFHSSYNDTHTYSQRHSPNGSTGKISPNQQQQHRHSHDSRSPRSSQGRSPNSYEGDGDRHDRDYREEYDHRSPNNNRYDEDDHQERGEGIGEGGSMVQFGGRNQFNERRRMSPLYNDDNDENTKSSHKRHSRNSPPNHRKNPLSPNNDFDQHRHHHNSYQSQHESLNYDQVQRLEQRNDPYHHGMYNNDEHQGKKSLQLKRLPDGQLIRSNPSDNSSPVSASSEFELSTDAEDNEYNDIRHNANSNMKSMLGNYSPHSEESEDDYGAGIGGQQIVSTRSKHYFSDSDHDTLNSPPNSGSLRLSRSNPDSMASPEDLHEYEDGHLGSGKNKASSSGTGGAGKSRFTFDNQFDEDLGKIKRRSPMNGQDRPPSPTAFQKIKKANRGGGVDDEKSQGTRSIDSAMSPRALAIKAAKNMRAQGKFTKEFAEFDKEKRGGSHQRSPEFENVRNTMRETKKRNGVIENFADFETFEKNDFHPRPTAAKSVADPTSPVSELLAQARARRKNRNNASQSINSEPALNAAMIRHQIKNLDKPSNLEAKKKLQQRREEKEKFLQLLQEGKNGIDEDSDKEKEKNESWLFDEVKGTLGPHGVTADLESLGERSNRSKTSVGNKSQRSHRSNKSFKSQRTSGSHRRSKRSDESVGSRHSRSSRYSVKSTKSHVSQMSQESRSVANDLIRLEMQLAMVGSNLKNGENEVKKQLELDAQRKGLKDGISVGENSLGIGSYTSRKKSQNAIPKRAKTIVRAPPGKLGIILANKTDSRGTVVSGVRTTSVLASKVSPGDRIIAIDGEDVSRMTVPEITAIMARKSDFERNLTVLKSPQK